jgi:pimeloyl-ACP methyl ester carboxylesterase
MPRTEQVDRGIGVWLRIHEGATDRLPVLLLHGLSQQSAFWDPVVRRMRTRPVAAMDQRGHGLTDTPIDVDYSIDACAADAVDALEHLGWPRAVVVGHSWGGAVAQALAARAPERVAAAVLIDGGLWGPADLGDREAVRERLTPPRLELLPEQLWERVQSGPLGDLWTDELRAALEPTFEVGDDGLVRTRLGFDRHMAVLDGLLDHDVSADIARVAASATPVWAVLCEGRDTPSSARGAAAARVEAHPNYRLLRWGDAVHDVPLQWPALVAGLIDQAVESRTALESSQGEGE